MSYLHVGNSHPAWHRSIHSPFLVSHLSGTAQLAPQLFSQLGPYNPSGHAVKYIKQVSMNFEAERKCVK